MHTPAFIESDRLAAASAGAARLRGMLADMEQDLVTLSMCSQQQKVILDELDFSKLKVELNPAACELKRAAQLFGSTLKQNNLELRLQLPPSALASSSFPSFSVDGASSGLWVVADSHRLSQVVVNLLVRRSRRVLCTCFTVVFAFVAFPGCEFDT